MAKLPELLGASWRDHQLRVQGSEPAMACAQRKTPVPPGFSTYAAALSLVMHKQRQQDDDWKWDSNQPKKCTFTKAHVCLHHFRWPLNAATQQRFRTSNNSIASRRDKHDPWDIGTLEAGESL
jgi:hypothetical protein